MITMRGISRFIAETLNESQEFIDLTDSLIFSEFNYYVNVDIYRLEEVFLPYASVVTFNDKDDKEVEKNFETVMLVGIPRQDFQETNGVFEEPTLDNLEVLSRKAVEVVEKELRTFGINGDKNIRISYINYFCPNPEGEDGLQMEISIKFEQDKYLGC